MTPKNTDDPEGDDSLGVLDDTASSDTIAIGPLGGTEQVRVTLPTGGEDDDLVDDEVVGGEVVSDLIIDTSAVADEDTLARISQETPEIVIELPAEELPDAVPADGEPAPEVDAEIMEPAPDVSGPLGDDAAPDCEADIVDAEIVPSTGAVPVTDAAASADAVPPAVRKPAGGRRKTSARRKTGAAPVSEPAPEASATAGQDLEAGQSAASAGAAAGGAATPADDAASGTRSAAPKRTQKASATSKGRKPSGRTAAGTGDDDPAATRVQETAAPDDDTAPPTGPAAPAAVAQAGSTDAGESAAEGLSHLESAVAAARAQLREAMSPTRTSPGRETPRTPAARTAEENPDMTSDDRDHRAAARPDADAIRTTPDPVHPVPEMTLASKRLGDLADAGREESADLLTADRLLDPSRVSRPEPEGAWSHLLYTISGGRINVGDSRRARERKELSARIAAPMTGTARFVPVLSRKGGVGKTTVTALLGMALADARDDRVIAVDANPDRGTLAERVVGGHTKSVRDLVRAQHEIRGFHDISALVARDETRLDVLASDSDPRVSEAFGDADYRDVAAVAAQYYSLVLTDSGTGIVHSVMGATLDLADQIVVVSGLSVDEARLASETLTWLESNGHGRLARDAIVVLNQSTPGAPLVRLGELEAHFSTRARQVLRIPYDPQIAGGGAIDYGSLQPATRRAAREIAAALVEGLRAKAA